MLPLYVTQFQRWRDAPINERNQIARDAARRYQVRELLPLPPDGNADERIGGMSAGDGQTFASCSDKERGAWAAWLRAVVKAAEDRRTATELAAALQKVGQI